MTFLASHARIHGLSIGLKNAGQILANLTSVVQFSVNEQCVQYNECTTFAPMVQAGKPVFHIEYPEEAPAKINVAITTSLCSSTGAGAGSWGFSTVLKDMDLDGFVEYCDRTTSTTPVTKS